jgi:hypothetical protein
MRRTLVLSILGEASISVYYGVPPMVWEQGTLYGETEALKQALEKSDS